VNPRGFFQFSRLQVHHPRCHPDGFPQAHCGRPALSNSRVGGSRVVPYPRAREIEIWRDCQATLTPSETTYKLVLGTKNNKNYQLWEIGFSDDPTKEACNFVPSARMTAK